MNSQFISEGENTMSVTMQMSANLVIDVGMRVYYDCPGMSGDSFEADRFFRKYQGGEGTIVGFPSEFVLPLDVKGRLPGTYYTTGSINVQFDGEEKVHEGLNIKHFVLMSPANTTKLNVPLTHQRADDLPNPIRFYPDDVVCINDDPEKNERVIMQVRITDDGTLQYCLSETVSERSERIERDTKTRTEAAAAGRIIIPIEGWFPFSAVVTEDQIQLLRPGNIRNVYKAPEQLSFQSAEDEIRFWLRDGLSYVAYDHNIRYPNGEHSLERAWQLFEEGAGDLIVKPEEIVKMVGKNGDYVVRRIHDCFEHLRPHVREQFLHYGAIPEKSAPTMEEIACEVTTGL